STDAQLRHDYKLGKQAGSAFLETENKVIAYQLEENRQPVAPLFDVTDTPSKDSANYSVKSEHAALNGKRPIKLPFPARRTGKIEKVDKENRISA
ncbi:MAG: patatin family protein, partial [Alteromonas sp.]|nr:patatin family protein [Alteromonas sp.]